MRRPGRSAEASRVGARRTVMLTFDDGPGPFTEEDLGVLAARDVLATLFVTGTRRVTAARGLTVMHWTVDSQDWQASGRSDPAAVRRIVDRGDTFLPAPADLP